MKTGFSPGCSKFLVSSKLMTKRSTGKFALVMAINLTLIQTCHSFDPKGPVNLSQITQNEQGIQSMMNKISSKPKLTGNALMSFSLVSPLPARTEHTALNSHLPAQGVNLKGSMKSTRREKQQLPSTAPAMSISPG